MNHAHALDTASMMPSPQRSESSPPVSVPFRPITPQPLREFRFTVNSLGRHRVTIYPGGVAQRFLPPDSLVIRFPDGSVAVVTCEA